jgi:hypothetical protein
MGNRGVLHDAEGLLSRKRWAHQNWVTCVLAFKGRRRHPLMKPGRYTELFFHDEAVAFAAGHRPCAECRRAAYLAYREAAGVEGTATDLDRRLHAERAVARVFRQRRHVAELSTLPGGAFILRGDRPALVWQGALHPFAPEGYGAPERIPHGEVTVLTPETTLTAFRAGYLPGVVLPG